MASPKIKLPTTLKDFDKLVDTLVKKYKLEDRNHAAAVLSVAIRHLPSTQAYATLDYFGHYILKSIANHIADHKNKMMRHSAQIDQLESLLRDDPANNQAIDELQKAATEGSQYAHDALLRLNIEPVGMSVAN